MATITDIFRGDVRGSHSQALSHRLLTVLLSALFVLVAAGSVRAQSTITIAWDANTETDLARYEVLWGTAPGQYGATVNVGLSTTWTLNSAAAGSTYYFTVRACNTAGLCSNQATPVSETIPGGPPLPPGPPFGAFETPANGITGVTGSLPVTGWALDNTGVSNVGIWRDPVAPEPAGALVFIGQASFVTGARPDVAAAYPSAPNNQRAGWGYMLLTNMLPGLGNGTYRLHAIATDTQGNQTNLGSRNFTATNNTATRPFGAIDTPAQGGTVSGTVYNNFGWVLSRGARRADPPGGGSVTVLIDGVPVGSPAGWTSRSDLSSLFPVSQYSGINTAAGVFSFNSTAFTNGLHTIAWVASDNQVPPNTDGIGSRYFTIGNAVSAAQTMSAVAAAQPMAMAATVQASAQPALLAAAQPALLDELNTTPQASEPVLARRGFNLESPFRRFRTEREGRVTIQGEELDRFELKPEGSMWTAGYLRYGDALSPLPIGSRLDPSTGTFTWQPGVGFVGTYDLVFVSRQAGQAVSTQNVRFVLNPKASGRVGPQVVIDAPTAGAIAQGDIFVGGWAIDQDAAEGTGVSTLHVWAYPADGSDPIFLGVAGIGGQRPDVGAIYGDQFRDSGYGMIARGLAPGNYNLAVFAWSTVSGGWVPAKTVWVTIR